MAPARPEDYDDYDEEGYPARPNPKANRPRTKRRPDHSDAWLGRVVGVDRGRYRLHALDDGASGSEVSAARARELRHEAIVVGDVVRAIGDSSPADARDELALVVGVEPRRTVLRRSADDTDTVERVVVANADRMLVVVAAAQPEPSLGLVDRCIVAAYDAAIEPIVVVTKTDLDSADVVERHLSGLDVPVIESRPDAVPVQRIRSLVDGHLVALVGHSGVGKSSLLNAVTPEAGRATGRVNAVTGRGRHTSSSAVAVPVGSGWLVDTPGVRSFGLGHVRPESVLRAFPDLEPVRDRLLATPASELDAEALAVGVDPALIGRVRSLVRLLSNLGKP